MPLLHRKNEMSKFFVDKGDIDDNLIKITDKNDIKHIKKVLRFKMGDEILVSDSDSFDYRSKIIEMTDNLISLRILDKQKFSGEPKVKVTLFQGIPKQGKMEAIIQKSVEIGVFSVVPVFTKRTIVTDKGNFMNKIERWQKISDEAVKQCQRGIRPVIEPPVDFEQMLERIEMYQKAIIPYENEERTTIKHILRGYSEAPETLALIIGPEGGFTEKEIIKATKIGCDAVSLGKTVLRTETAGITALAMIMYELEL